MVKAWLFQPRDGEGPRDPNQGSFPIFVTLQELQQLGVHYTAVDPKPYQSGQQKATDGRIAEIAKERGYKNHDVITVSRQSLGDQFESKIKSFFAEHLHDDEEIRFIVEGSGYFDVRTPPADCVDGVWGEESWVRILVEPGDLLIVPAGIYHRFTLDTNAYIKAFRLFTEEPKWTPHPRGSFEEAKNTSRVQYLKSLKIDALPRGVTVEGKSAFSLQKWIATHLRDDGYSAIHSKGCQFKVSVRGSKCSTGNGFHTSPSEVWFYQISGTLTLTLIDGGKHREVVCGADDCFLLAAGIPYCANRGKDSVGLVVEKYRLPEEKDCMHWECKKCSEVVHRHWFVAGEDPGAARAAAVEKYTQSPRTCTECEQKGGDTGGELEQKTGKRRKTESKSPPEIDSSTHPFEPFSLVEWVADNKKDLKPPVGNKMVHGRGCQFKIMVVGGPNVRTDYHVESGEEWFFMLKGDMNLKILDGGKHRDVPIREGECFLLPAYVPHSPQRTKDSIGLVIERDRTVSELDFQRYYCRATPECVERNVVIRENVMRCTDLGTQIKEGCELYYSNATLRRCPECNVVDSKP